MRALTLITLTSLSRTAVILWFTNTEIFSGIPPDDFNDELTLWCPICKLHNSGENIKITLKNRNVFVGLLLHKQTLLGSSSTNSFGDHNLQFYKSLSFCLVCYQTLLDNPHSEMKAMSN